MSRDVDPLACAEDAAHDWAARHRVAWALVATMRRASSITRSVSWDARRRAFVVADNAGLEQAAHEAADRFWWSDTEAARWRRPAEASDPAAPVTCECGLVVVCGAALELHRMGIVHRERMTEAHAA